MSNFELLMFGVFFLQAVTVEKTKQTMSSQIFKYFEFTYLKISINKIVDLKVLIIITKGIEQCFGYFCPTHVAEKLYQCEKWYLEQYEEIIIRSQGVALAREKLAGSIDGVGNIFSEKF